MRPTEKGRAFGLSKSVKKGREGPLAAVTKGKPRDRATPIDLAKTISTAETDVPSAHDDTSAFEIHDERFLTLIDPAEPLEKIAGGFEFLEGPAWHPYEKHLIFSDIIGDTIYRLKGEGDDRKIEVFRRPSRKANGNTYDRQGRLLSCEHATSTLVREQPEEAPEILARLFNGKELNSPNDVIVKSDGNVFFTDPNSGRTARYGIERAKELSFQGLFLLNPESGVLTLLADDFKLPNGLCFSPDESILYVNDTTLMHIRAFDTLEDSRGFHLENGRIFAELTGKGDGKPDGMKTDTFGNLFCTGPGGIHVFDPEANLLGRILMPQFSANFTWGDGDLKSLYITASENLYRIRMKQSGPKLF